MSLKNQVAKVGLFENNLKKVCILFGGVAFYAVICINALCMVRMPIGYAIYTLLGAVRY